MKGRSYLLAEYSLKSW